MIVFTLLSMMLTATTQYGNSIHLKFATVEQAQKLLVTEDSFTAAWSQFDIDSRMGKAGSSREELLSFIPEQVLEWTEEEKKKIVASLKRVEQSIKDNGLAIVMDKAVFLVKTTAEEEGGAAAYTRGNYIVCSEAFAQMPPEGMDKVLVHELFHVISRSQPELREELYGLIGFEMMPEIAYPKALRAYRITNPDATQTDSYITVTVGGKAVPCMMILYAKGDYTGGSFFNYLSIGFLELQGDETKSAVIGREGPVIHGMDEVENFFEQVGRNTQYIIHPEEIIADNFAFAVLGEEGLPDQELVQRIQAVLKK